MTGAARAGTASATGTGWPDPDLRQWYEQRREASTSTVTQVPLDALRDWRTDPVTGDLGHRSGQFFTVTGLDVRGDGGPVPGWQQPIISQPEIGLLGLLVRRRAGLECLVQAKMEPGNVNGVQISPTVQATRSNYTRIHGGAGTPYMEHFVRPARGSVVADVLQSEQGSWFLGKRNRNMVVEAAGPVPAQENFRWITLRDLQLLMGLDNVVNMDTRTVLACLAAALPPPTRTTGDAFAGLVARGFSPTAGAVERDVDVLSWLTALRSHRPLDVRRIGLSTVSGWHRDRYAIDHDGGRHFGIIGVEVRTTVREVPGWRQPLLRPRGRGIVAFLARPIGGVLHVLARAAVQPGLRDAPEIGPTVQCRPENYAHLPMSRRPPFLDAVLSAPRERIRYDCVLSEEGGRFHHAENRYMVVEADERVPVRPSEEFRWVTPRQLATLLAHSHYVNVEGRSLLAALYSLAGSCP
ncbi:NDP-hexose 2,3-dehydratase family protein [Micromonospora echinofusca]|uniref:Oxidase EvaA n=1 Tax=Micromonospora echinofusca TaxID=47858 RepID=A0A1C5GI60_MICEH|nr:NDP-hexose 2,3-dehydratase family protein [Micromonospora echinofusca]SCG19490.1 oxidase EvaA [Micromonospora echinofusca]